MQRTEADGIVISCDFCLTDWDEVRPMIEGHRGSVLCLDCLRRALDASAPAETGFDCTLCLRHHEAGRKTWRNPAHPAAALCFDCVRLAAKGFHKDPDTDFRWDPSKYPAEP